MANNTDIYNIMEEIQDIQKKYIDEDQEVLSVGLYGYLADQFATMTQNTIMMASEWGNEAFPTRAKFEKTILSNAITCNINDINAVPATMDMKIGVIKSVLDKVMDDLGRDEYIIKKDTNIRIDEYTFRLEQDIKIVRKRRPNGVYLYYAMHLVNGEYILEEPYLPAPNLLKYNNDVYLFFDTKLRQMEVDRLSRRAISNSLLDNKTIDFDFRDQLYKFDVTIKKPDGTTVSVKPIFEGEVSNTDRYCNYYFTTPHTIRVKFNKYSYMPSMNDEIQIEVYTTLGEKGNFSCDEEILFSSSYEGFTVQGIILPIGDTYGGINRKSIKELKNIIPKERLSRGILSNDKDLENFFNIMDPNSRLKMFKKRHNQLERCYYSYLLVKDSVGNVIPTNTVNIDLFSSSFIYEDTIAYVLPPNIPLLLKGDYVYPAKIERLSQIEEYEQKGFIYTCPFVLSVNKKPLFVSYYLNVIDNNYKFTYDYINTNGYYQFITSKLKIYKNHIYDNDNYYVTFNVKTNILNKLFVKDVTNPGEKSLKFHPVLVLIRNGFRYYIEGTLTGVENITSDNKEFDSCTVEFKLNTDNIINDKGVILNDVYQFGTETKVNASFPEETDCEVYLYIEDPSNTDPVEHKYPIPNNKYENYYLANKLSTTEPISLYYDYTEIMNSVATVTDTIGSNPDGKKNYSMMIKSVPVVKYSYMQDISKCDEFISYVHRRKNYMDYALDLLENNFTIDFKFFNTYGPSKMFTINRNGELLNKVNIELNFSYRPKLGANIEIVKLMTDSAKEYIENINTKDTINSIHIMNLIAYLKDKYNNDIEFIEFRGINNYDTSYQYIEKQQRKLLDEIPEFININLDNYGEPDIHFTLV